MMRAVTLLDLGVRLSTLGTAYGEPVRLSVVRGERPNHWTVILRGSRDDLELGRGQAEHDIEAAINLALDDAKP